jgi:tyrosyl-tRNA synthetase
MLLRHSVQSRLSSEVGMSFTEFCYQVFQAYDWLHLLQRYDCRFQVGGNDQMGNIVAGHELISRVANIKVYGTVRSLIHYL